ncbi:pyocin activator PrtN family protein [Gammaproteobacteria bacterium AS21]
MNSTFFGLLAEFETAEIPLKLVCEKYLGLSSKMAHERASLNKLPIPTYRGGSQKSIRLVSASSLAKHIDDCKKEAVLEWEKFNNKAKNS